MSANITQNSSDFQTVAVVNETQQPIEVKMSEEAKQTKETQQPIEVKTTEETKPTPLDMIAIFDEIKKTQEQLTNYKQLEEEVARLKEKNTTLEKENAENRDKLFNVLSVSTVYEKEREKVFKEMISKFPVCSSPAYNKMHIVKCTTTKKCYMVFYVENPNFPDNHSLFSRMIVATSEKSYDILKNANFLVSEENMQNICAQPHMHVEIGSSCDYSWNFIIVSDDNSNKFYGCGPAFLATYYPFDLTKETRQRV